MTPREKGVLHILKNHHVIPWGLLPIKVHVLFQVAKNAIMAEKMISVVQNFQLIKNVNQIVFFNHISTKTDMFYPLSI